MFESALITRAGVERQVDLGLLAETVFFYRSVQLTLNGASIVALATQIPLHDLISLLTRSELKLSYVHPNFGVISSGHIRVHEFGAFTFAGMEERRARNYKDEIAMRLEERLGSTSATRKLVNTLIDRVSLHKFRETPEGEKIIPDLARGDIADKNFTRLAALATLRNLVPDYNPPSDFRFELFNTGEGYAVDTNIDFSAVNKLYHRAVPPSHSSMSSKYLLAHIINARADSYFGAHYMAEIVTTPLLSDIIRLKHFDFLRRRELNVSQIDLFQETSLPDVPTIRETMNSGGRTVSDFLRLLDNAERFRAWLQNINPDADLVRSYYLAATKKTWAEKLPTKSVRFMIASGLGVLADLVMPTGFGSAAGLSVGAADSLYLDRLIKGWRPNQFIEGPYGEFVSGSSSFPPRKIA
jgi:hypothetical protein